MKYLFTILLFISTALIAVAQAPTPNAAPGYNPCGEGEKYDAAANTCQHSTSQWLWHDGGIFIILGIILIPTAIFVGRKYFVRAGGKSTPTARPQ
jgi:hypothetical protein